MTCGMCGYEFCWVCGAQARQEDNHFGSSWRGCGATLFEEAQPMARKWGSEGACKKRSKRCAKLLP